MLCLCRQDQTGDETVIKVSLIILGRSTLREHSRAAEAGEGMAGCPFWTRTLEFSQAQGVLKMGLTL